MVVVDVRLHGGALLCGEWRRSRRGVKLGRARRPPLARSEQSILRRQPGLHSDLGVRTEAWGKLLASSATGLGSAARLGNGLPATTTGGI